MTDNITVTFSSENMHSLTEKTVVTVNWGDGKDENDYADTREGRVIMALIGMIVNSGGEASGTH